MNNIERLERCANIMRRKWVYDPETGLLFSRETKNVIKGSLTNKNHLLVTVSEGKFRTTISYQKACYVYAYGAFDESLFDVHHLNLNKQDNRIKNICLMPKEKHHRIHKNVRKLIRLGHTRLIQPNVLEESL